MNSDQDYHDIALPRFEHGHDVTVAVSSVLSGQALVQACKTLDKTELQRLGQFHLDEDRARFVSSHTLLRQTLEAVSGIAARKWQFTRESSGRWVIDFSNRGISLPSLNFSIAHASSCVAVAISKEFNLGLDVENESAGATALSAEVAYTAGELASLARLQASQRPSVALSIWTLKEAYAKMIGLGVDLDFASFEVDWTIPKLLQAPTANGPSARLLTRQASFHDENYYIALALGSAQNGYPEKATIFWDVRERFDPENAR